MGKEEMKPEKKNMTSKELENFIIEYVKNSPFEPYEYQLMRASKLVGEEDPFALASYLESMTDESRDTFFKIVKDNKERNGKETTK